MNDYESRLIELETRLAFQDDSIQQLSDTIARQQQSIDQLTEMVKILNRQLKSLPTEMTADAGSEPPPPHY